METRTGYYQSPIGIIKVTGTFEVVDSVWFIDSVEKHTSDINPSGAVSQCQQQLKDYFNGKLTSFTVPLRKTGTPFQQRVWDELTQIPYAKTISYLQLAKQLGDEKVIRAAAHANGQNPLGIIVPCHRVIGSDGSLTGYAGGLHRKQWLLDHEAKVNGSYQKLF
jgi:methylated-DNA-[protein]-cysteine S-methyltransferase